MERLKIALALGLLFAAVPGNGLGIPVIASGHGSIRIDIQFSTAEINRIKDELGGLASNNFSFYIPSGVQIAPYNEVLALTSYYTRGGSEQLYGSTTLGGGARPVTLYQLLFAQPAVIMRSVMLHEADHHRFGAHTCGQAADQDDNGPYGVGAYYAALVSRQSANLDASQREILANLARSVAVYQICSPAAQANLFNAIDAGIFPTPPPPPPPPQPPPRPVFCTYDDVGNMICDG